jgi:murein DD-endopeptidase MepM/ murein hydrolase activator NlpD
MMATYKVKKGDTLRTIAAKAGISLKELVDLNPQINNPNLVSGQVITTSKTTPVTATPTVPVTPVTATGTATAIPRNIDKDIAEATAAGNRAVQDINEVYVAEATAAGNQAVEDINEILDSEFEEEDTPLRTVKFRTPKYNPINGKLTGYEITYSDGTVEFEAVETGEEDPDETDVTTTTYTAPDGTIFTNLDLYNAYIGKLKSDEKRQRGQSAYELLYEEFDRYGLASLVKDVEEFIKDGLSKAELTLKLRGTKTYQTRFAANADRVKNGLAAISEAEYIGLEDQYQNIMRNYGLPESYYARSKDGFGTQIGFQKFIANDVSATELEERVIAGQERVLNSNPEVLAALKSFYPGITNGDDREKD